MPVEVSFELQSEAVPAATICKCIHSADGEVGYGLQGGHHSFNLK
jgi:hypothetical protein